MEMSYHSLFFGRNIHYIKTTFLHFYQVIAAVPGRLLTKGKTDKFSAKMMKNVDPESFYSDENVVINLLRAKSKDFYWLIVNKKYKEKNWWKEMESNRSYGQNKLDKYIYILGTEDFYRK